MAEMYAVSGETLTGIADAIRSKTGSDDFLTVASMAAAIEGISGGGGLPAKISKIWHGTALGNATGSLTIPHGLAEVPDMILYWCEDIPIKADAGITAAVCGFKTYSSQPVGTRMGGVSLSVRETGAPSATQSGTYGGGFGIKPTAAELTIGTGAAI